MPTLLIRQGQLLAQSYPPFQRVNLSGRKSQNYRIPSERAYLTGVGMS